MKKYLNISNLKQQKRGKNRMKIYEIGFDYANYNVIFTFKINKDY